MSPFIPVLSLIGFLAAYEGIRGVVALKKGKRFALVTKDFLAAAVIGGIAILILYVWYEYFHKSWGSGSY